MKTLIIVESPAKAKTLTKFLGNDYTVLASFGHIRDLPKNELGFDPNDNFKPKYIISNDKKKVVTELKRNIYKDTIIYLATDEDREGEAIAWHLMETLNIKNYNPKRIVFHEITKQAILDALKHPRELDINMVDAQQARRILDRAVGYKLSPLLWKKIKFGLSAGRVQSVATRIVVEREQEIQAFNPVEYWKLKLDIFTNPAFKAEFNKHNGKSIEIHTGEEASFIKSECDKYDYILSSIEEKESYRNPPPPFTTSTLQQEASLKAGLSPKQTMMIAQKLYEGGVNIPNVTGGIITYMRTDAVNLSKVATDAAKLVITSEFGAEYALDTPRVYNTKSNAKVAAQEAHEAIRPVHMELKPSDLTKYLDAKELKLYTLIWNRTMATQMKQAIVSNTTYKIYGGKDREYEFVAKGTKILFPGFMKLYVESNEDGEETLSNKEKFLPNIPLHSVFKDTLLTTEQNFTKPPARYTEASLIKKMEQEGIGRPSTYATTLSTILTRGYVELNKDKQLIPTKIGIVVTEYLKNKFPNIVDMAFTANIETEFDKIASGAVKWESIMHSFYDNFDKMIHDEEGGERVQYSEDKILGIDPETGLNIHLRVSTNGPFIQIGESNKETKTKAYKISSIPKGVSPETLTLEDALYYTRIPRILGKRNEHDVKVAIGKFGPYIECNKKYYSIKPSYEVDIYTMVLDQAIHIMDEVDAEKEKALLWFKDGTKYGDISIINGRFGPYISTTGNILPKGMYKIPKDMLESSIRELSLDEVITMIDSQYGKPANKFNKHKHRK